MNSPTDRIERQVLQKVPRACVWRAASNAEEFGAWFGVALQRGAFIAGQRMQGDVTYPGYEHVLFDVLIERAEPEKYLSWRWHPAAIERGVDYSQEPTTLVEFVFADADGGSLLRVLESGVDQVPPQRRCGGVSHEQWWLGRTNDKHKHACRDALAHRSRTRH